MRITGHTFIYRALTGGIVALALVMTNVTAHAAPITEQEAHSIGVDAYREMHFLGKYDSRYHSLRARVDSLLVDRPRAFFF